MTERYEFVHVVYRQVLYDRQTPVRRAKLHRWIGERVAAMSARRIEDVVPEWAYHFEHGADGPRAIDFFRQAAKIAGRGHSHRQADTLLARALELVNHLPSELPHRIHCPEHEPLRRIFVSASGVARVLRADEVK